VPVRIFSLEELQRLPAKAIFVARCEQGWSYIAEWTGVRLATVFGSCRNRSGGAIRRLEPFRIQQSRTLDARIVGDHDMADALHAQTLLAYGMKW